jgi:hypothetical protein
MPALTAPKPPAVAAAAATAAAADLPAADLLQALRAALAIGHVRGVLGQLDALQSRSHAGSALAALVAQARPLVRGFQLDAVAHLLDTLDPGDLEGASATAGPASESARA